MKKLLIILLLLTAKAQAQPFLRLEGTNKGASLSFGHLDVTSGIEFNIGYHVPLVWAYNPTIFNFSVGKQVLISHYDEDNFSVTPMIGIAYESHKSFDGVKDNGRIVYPPDGVKISGVKPIYTLELGKDWHTGRLFLSANYCHTTYFGLGIRAFIK